MVISFSFCRIAGRPQCNIDKPQYFAIITFIMREHSHTIT